MAEQLWNGDVFTVLLAMKKLQDANTKWLVVRLKCCWHGFTFGYGGQQVFQLAPSEKYSKSRHCPEQPVT